MAIIQMDIQVRAPSPFPPAIYYYWTNTYFFNDSLPPIGASHRSNLQTLTKVVHCDVVVDQSYRTTTPPGSGLSPIVIQTAHIPGFLPYGGDYTLYNIVRVNLLAGGKRVGYKLCRACVGVQYINDGLWDEDVTNQLQSNYFEYLLRARACTSDGLAIDDVQVSRRVGYWGLRQGSRRSTRPVIPLS